MSFYFHGVLGELNTFIFFEFSVPEGSSFCDSGRLNFRAFAWRGIAGGRESSYVG